MRTIRPPTNTEKAILDAYSGSLYGRSISDVKAICEKRGGPLGSSIDHLQPGLVKDGLLIPMNQDRPRLFKPHWEIPMGEEPKKPITSKELAGLDLIQLAHTRALEIIKDIDKDESWSKRKQINNICYNEISPFIDTIMSLRRAGYPIPSPNSYSPFFDSDLRAYWKGILGRKDIAGPISVYDLNHIPEPLALALILDGPRRKWTKQLHWANPNLVEWQRYLKDIAVALEKEIEHHKQS